MITIIKNADVYAPIPLGQKDLLLLNDKIEGIYDHLEVPQNFGKVQVIDAKGKYVVPGFIDSHVHFLGEGGEGSFHSRTPELELSDLIQAGITTVIGCLGTDGVCRDVKALFAKAKALEEDGVTSYIYTGSYEVPVITITGNIKSDIMLIDKILGVGELAISDHRSSQPTFEDFIKVVAQARVGGMLSNKAGIVNVHIGDGAGRLSYLIRMAEETEIPVTQVLPTHINRSGEVFEDGIRFAKLGGYVDLTTSTDPDYVYEGEIKASTGIKLLLQNEISPEQITLSSDGQGSYPSFNEKGQLVAISIAPVGSLYSEMRDSVLEDGVSLENALMTVTSNPADILKLSHKGRLKEGADADILILERASLKILNVIAKGKELYADEKVLAKGIYDK